MSGSASITTHETCRTGMSGRMSHISLRFIVVLLFPAAVSGLPH